MQTYRERLHDAARELSSQYDTIKSEAQRRLGTLFNASDYPTTLDGLFDLEVSYPTIEPPAYLVSLHPDVYQAEQARVRERFESAVELAAQAFATELQRHVEPDRDGFWWADMGPVDGPTLGPFRSRSEALGAEREWLLARVTPPSA